MSIVLIISIVIIITVLVQMNKKKSALKAQSQINPVIYSSSVENCQPEASVLENNNSIFGPIQEIKSGEWLINPGAAFGLIILCQDGKIVQQVRNLLDDNVLSYSDKRNKLLNIFALHNVKVKEIEAYKDKYKIAYTNTVNNLIKESAEWRDLGEKDKEDLLSSFKKQAIENLPERPNCNLEDLFENEPTDINFDDELIHEYGIENLKSYLSFSRTPNKIYTIPIDDNRRSGVEKLVELKLAERGMDLNCEEILSMLTLKELNIIASNPEKEYKRKNQAIDYIIELPDFEVRVKDNISFRELFKMLPLPEKYSGIDVAALSAAWNYHILEIEILSNTYGSTKYFTESVRNNSSNVKYYTIYNNSTKNNSCPCCDKVHGVEFTKRKLPNLPHHIGCSCYLHVKYDFSKD